MRCECKIFEWDIVNRINCYMMLTGPLLVWIQALQVHFTLEV